MPPPSPTPSPFTDMSATTSFIRHKKITGAKKRHRVPNYSKRVLKPIRMGTKSRETGARSLAGYYNVGKDEQLGARVTLVTSGAGVLFIFVIM